MRRIAVLLMTMSALTVVCCGCAWKSNFDWCEREVNRATGKERDCSGGRDYRESP